ncbi:MAG TPA: 4Fe-4S double cluster binding domain-containing protein [Clostridium sp.]|uniref:epoxyqueuosine reductase n=1 Tax=Clostridium sp. TaxID=1506 RepID=UPI002F925E80
MQEDISTKVKKKAYELGYDLCGIIEAKSFKEFSEYLNVRVEKFPSSTHLYKNLIGLAEPLEKAPWGKSIIVCIRRYNKYKVPENLDKLFGKVFLFDGRVENSKEYYGNILFTQYLENQGMKTCQEEVSARWAAVKAGLGYFGKNNFVYTEFGSFVWIDTWIVDLRMEYDKESDDKMHSCPEHCHRCVDACPTKALCEDYTMDRGSCIAHLSFYSSELPSEDIRNQMGTWMYGCDKCQDVCPMNKGKWSDEEHFPEIDNITNLLSLEQILTMDENTFLNVIIPRFWYISKDRIWLWKCNAIRAMVNSKDNKYYDLIKEACKDNNDKIKTMAIWACNKLEI